MTFEELIDETGSLIGIEGFAPNEDGLCVIASEIGEISIIQCKNPMETVLLNAPITEVPAAADAALLAALEANKGFRDTKGATLSVDAETNRFELSQYALLDDLDPDSLVAMIEDFATTLVGLRDKLNAAQSQADGDGGAAELEETISQFIRV
jgi:hypothetical protein